MVEPGPLFSQARDEIAASLDPLFAKRPELKSVFMNLLVPEKIHIWKAVWDTDSGERRVSLCYRVQHSSALGPYKGGLRFDTDVSLDTFRFLALEQTIKNSLTGKPMGGAKGGCNINPKALSPSELRRFCEAFMLGLKNVIGQDIDVPAGDIGVDSTVINLLFGAWRRLGGGFEGVLTGKGLFCGGSKLRTEATGFGVIYLLSTYLFQTHSQELSSKTLLVSGAGNVATFCAKKAIELGAKVLTLSDRSGTYFCSHGFTSELVDNVLNFKASEHNSQKNSKTSKNNNKVELDEAIEFFKDEKPWTLKKLNELGINVDIAIPCATQNEVDKPDLESLLKLNLQILCEGSNLSTTSSALEIIRANPKIDYIPGKLANLGGVTVSFLEMSQNAQKSYWSEEKVNEELKSVMERAYQHAKDSAEEFGVSFSDGANIAGFLKVAEAMKQEGFA